ncbi:hypothetical protein [Streptomyces hydrogenans]|uniref:hypothetical protein n=1 Tax=Streptomyces hydrogenans TaxID=1873719 RepID=UPI00341BC3AC
MGVRTAGPAWAEAGLGRGSPEFPLAVEGPVGRPVDRLVPDVSSVTEYARHSTLHATVAAESGRRNLDAAECPLHPLASVARQLGLSAGDAARGGAPTLSDHARTSLDVMP